MAATARVTGWRLDEACGARAGAVAAENEGDTKRLVRRRRVRRQPQQPRDVESGAAPGLERHDTAAFGRFLLAPLNPLEIAAHREKIARVEPGGKEEQDGARKQDERQRQGESDPQDA
jgi:hypothetical protein